MAVPDFSPLFRVVLRLAGLRIVFEVSHSQEPGDDLAVEEICGSILPEEPLGGQESRSPAPSQPRGPAPLESRSPGDQQTSWLERLQWAKEAGASAAAVVNNTSTTWTPAPLPRGPLGGAVSNRTWVVVKGKRDCPEDCRDGVVCAKSGHGPGGMTTLIGSPADPQAVYHGFPSAAELGAYLDSYRGALVRRAPQ